MMKRRKKKKNEVELIKNMVQTNAVETETEQEREREGERKSFRIPPYLPLPNIIIKK